MYCTYIIDMYWYILIYIDLYWMYWYVWYVLSSATYDRISYL